MIVFFDIDIYGFLFLYFYVNGSLRECLLLLKDLYFLVYKYIKSIGYKLFLCSKRRRKFLVYRIEWKIKGKSLKEKIRLDI